MLRLRLAPRLFVISLATITLILMSASMMAAQTPTASVEKAVVESNQQRRSLLRRLDGNPARHQVQLQRRNRKNSGSNSPE